MQALYRDFSWLSAHVEDFPRRRRFDKVAVPGPAEVTFAG